MRAGKKQKKKGNVSRLLWLALLFIAWMTAIIWRLTYLQVTRHDYYHARAEAQRQDAIAVSPLRGTIVDRNGSNLAVSTDTDSIFVYTREVTDPEKISRTLAPLLGEREGDLIQKLTGSGNKNRFIWLKRKVDFETAKAITGAVEHSRLSGVHFVKEPQRYYPNGALGAHLLGYVNIDEQGLAGLELAHDKNLRGRPGQAFFEVDGRHQPFDRHDTPAVNGSRVELTIDAALQHQVESILEKARNATQARSATAIVLDPKTGEILALANAPDFDPNQRPKRSGDDEEDRVRRNRAITDVYEPGSVFKIVTYSGVIEEGLARPDDKVDCQGGQITLYGRTIRDSHLGTGVVTVADALAKSSNVGAIKMAQRLGEARLADYVSRFGFGHKTGIDLPGEVSGLVNNLRDWHGTSYASIAMGHEVGVTALQAVTAMAAIANGGVRIQPHVVRKVTAEDGRVIYEANPEAHRAISERTANTLTGMLEGVVTHGTARRGVKLAGYKAAGKTGTAQKVLPGGGYSNTKFVASFAGFVPTTNPRFAIIVVLDEPVGLHQGGQVAAPIFGEIAEAALAGSLVKPDGEEYQQQIAKLQEKARAESAKPAEQAEAAKSENVKPEAKEAATKTEEAKEPQPEEKPEQQEKPGKKSGNKSAGAEREKKAETKDKEIVVNKSGSSAPVIQNNLMPAAAGPGVMPDLRGRSLRAVAQTCASLDLKLKVSGSGVAARQSPAPGARVRPGESCKVEFQ